MYCLEMAASVAIFFILNLMVLLRIENLFIEILFNIPTQQKILINIY